MKQFEMSYIDSLIRDLQNAIKSVNEVKEFCTIKEYRTTRLWIEEAQNSLKNALGSIQDESGSRMIDSHQELK